jgi:hypothetical protein
MNPGCDARVGDADPISEDARRIPHQDIFYRQELACATTRATQPEDYFLRRLLNDSATVIKDAVRLLHQLATRFLHECCATAHTHFEL